MEIRIESFERIVFFTGAGLSAESGLPTYRGAGGIWGSYAYEDYACQRAFDRDPGKVWDFHDERRRVMGAAQPSQAHTLIAAVQQRLPATRIVTQNIDGLHQRAGASAVTELHGSVWRVRCACHGGARANHEVPIAPRTCPACGAWLRPDIVWFEDAMPPAPIEAAMETLAACDLLVSVGTSGVVYPAAQLPQIAQQAGALCIEINPESTAVSGGYALHMRTTASAGLAQLWPSLAEGHGVAEDQSAR